MSNLDVIKALYKSFANKDWDRFAELSDPGLEWIQNEGFPKGKHSFGTKEVVKNVFDVFAKDWETWSFEIEEYLEAGDNIIVIGSYQGRHKETASKNLPDMTTGVSPRVRNAGTCTNTNAKTPIMTAASFTLISNFQKVAAPLSGATRIKASTLWPTISTATGPT